METTGAIPLRVRRLFARMASVGPGSQLAYEQEVRTFMSSDDPLGTLQQVYTRLPSWATGARWKAVYAATKILNPASVAFLEQVAMTRTAVWVPSAAPGMEPTPTPSWDTGEEPPSREGRRPIC